MSSKRHMNSPSYLHMCVYIYIVIVFFWGGSCLNTGSQWIWLLGESGSLLKDEEIIYPLLQSLSHAPMYIAEILVGAQTPTLLLICSSFSRKNGYPLLVCSSLSTAQNIFPYKLKTLKSLDFYLTTTVAVVPRISLVVGNLKVVYAIRVSNLVSHQPQHTPKN